MPRRPRIGWILLCGALGAQTIPTLRITVALVQVDAVVTDSSGRHVMDLRPEDFEILQDGESRPVTFFSIERGPAPQPVNAVLPVSTPVTSAAQVKRVVALVVDDLALT